MSSWSGFGYGASLLTFYCVNMTNRQVSEGAAAAEEHWKIYDFPLFNFKVVFNGLNGRPESKVVEVSGNPK